MGNSTSQERHSNSQSEPSSTANSRTPSIQEHHHVGSERHHDQDRDYDDDDIHERQQRGRENAIKAVMTGMSSMSSESIDSQPHAQHREVAEGPTDGMVERVRDSDTIVDDMNFQHLNVGSESENSKSERSDENSTKPVSRLLSGEEIDFYYGQPSEQYVPTLISWIHGGRKVYVTGTFTGWRKMIKLNRNGNEFSTVVNLPPGTHRIRFVVDNELRCSDALPTATDSMGNLVNYIEVSALDLPALEREGRLEEEKFEETTSILPLEYTNEIPEIFTNPEASERYISEDYPAPPYLPPHLETVILNTNSTEKDDSSVLPIPNHVVLNHLATTSIKHNVLAVASVSRYSRKYVTQILYAPL
ncbi:5'-AMP-activated protein kinase beta subunit, interation domain-containing protein [Dipodascopsis uninucleata]